MLPPRVRGGGHDRIQFALDGGDPEEAARRARAFARGSHSLSNHCAAGEDLGGKSVSGPSVLAFPKENATAQPPVTKCLRVTECHRTT